MLAGGQGATAEIPMMFEKFDCRVSVGRAADISQQVSGWPVRRGMHPGAPTLISRKSRGPVAGIASFP